MWPKAFRHQKEIEMKRYHPIVVAAHWIAAIMILVALFIGGPALSELESTDPLKTTALGGHMIWGLVIGFLMLVRVIMRLTTKNPPAADAGNEMLNKGAKGAHLALYVLVFAMVASGLGIAFTTDLFAVAFGDGSTMMPATFEGIPPRVAHGIISSLITILVIFHVIGWGYHQFVRKDSLLSRMWFGRRSD